MTTKSTRSVLGDGVAAGLLGGLAVAIWFLLFDVARGHPFQTPAMLGAALLHASPVPADTISFALRALEYSVFHFTIFALFGLTMAWLMLIARPTPRYLFAMVALFAVFEVLFVSLVTLMRPELQPWISGFSVLVANLLATAVITAYFFVRNPTLGGNLLGAAHLSVVTEGILSGVIGGAIVSAWFLLLDLRAGVPLRTPAALGAAFLGNSRVVTQTVTPFVIGYTVLHFSVFIALGVIVAAMLAASEHQPLFRIGLVLTFVLLEFCFLGLINVIDDSLFDVVGSLAVTAGNLLACAGMLGFFFFRHRDLDVWRYLLFWQDREV